MRPNPCSNSPKPASIRARSASSGPEGHSCHRRVPFATALDAAGGNNLEVLGADVASQCLQRGCCHETSVRTTVKGPAGWHAPRLFSVPRNVWHRRGPPPRAACTRRGEVIMVADEVFGRPWTRKHDDPRTPLIAHAPRIVYPTSLEDVIAICRDRRPDERLKAAGSHWALSGAAISDHTFIETHDPHEDRTVMGRTLREVVPGALDPTYFHNLARAEVPWYLIHIEAGKRIYQAYAELDQIDDLTDPSTLSGRIKQQFGLIPYAGPWAFATLGGAGGQTVVGALSTGTHGGDFDRPPLADAVVALHLVVDGGRHHWIEPGNPADRITDDDQLHALYGTARFGGPDNFAIIRDTEVFNAALVSVGRFGVIYSVVLKVAPQYALWEKRRLHVWQDLREKIWTLDSDLYVDPLPPPATFGAQQRFLQVAVSLTSHANFTKNLAGVTRRWNAKLNPDTAGHAERIGDRIGHGDDPHLGAPRYTHAGTTHAYSPDDDNPHTSADPGFLEKACADASFLRGAISATIDEIEKFVLTQHVATASGLAAVTVVGGSGLLSLLPALAVILLILKAILAAFDDDTRLGEVMNGIKDKLLDPSASLPERAAGLLAWQILSYKAFASLQGDRDYDALSYAVMDQHDYLNISCEVNVDSVEVFFDATDSRLIAFVDALLIFETQQELHGKACVGYASLRFTGPTRATLGMQRWQRSCAVEVSCLRDVTGGEDLINYAVAWARNPNNGALLHWGQRNDWTRSEVERAYGSSVKEWRQILARLTHNGARAGFSSAFTVRTGLEVQ